MTSGQNEAGPAQQVPDQHVHAQQAPVQPERRLSPADLHHGVPQQRLHSEVFAPSRPGPSVDGEVTE